MEVRDISWLSLDGAGKISLKKLTTNEQFSFKTKKLKGSTIALLNESGIAFGPLVLYRSTSKKKAYLGFSGIVPAKSKNIISIGSINLKTGYALPTKLLKTDLVSKTRTLISKTDSSGNPVGAATGGIAAVAGVSSSASRKAFEASESLSSPGSDSDSDGIIDALDPDVDGDGIPNIADADFRGNDDATFSSLFLSLQDTLNANIATITDDMIDAIIAAENRFSIGFWFSLPPESSITGGHVICSDSNSYCNRTSGTAVYSGLTESNTSLVGQLWRTLNANGRGYPNLEFLSVRGGNAIAGAIQPRVGTSAVRPGDTFLVEYTGNAGNTIDTKLLVLSPYLVTVPALKSFTVGSTTTEIDYSSLSGAPGTSGNPITTDSSGNVTLNFWRPQRLLYRSETPASSTDRYRDLGYLSYGLLFEGVSRQFTCAGLYSNLSSDLTEASTTLGTDSSPFPDQGANLFSLKDGAGDATPTTSRYLTVTVDLHTCLTRAGLPIGDYQLAIRASGEELSGGSNSSAQTVFVRVQ